MSFDDYVTADVHIVFGARIAFVPWLCVIVGLAAAPRLGKSALNPVMRAIVFSRWSSDFIDDQT